MQASIWLYTDMAAKMDLVVLHVWSSDLRAHCLLIFSGYFGDVVGMLWGCSGDVQVVSC